MSLKRETILVWTAMLSLFCLTNSGFDTSEGVYHYEVAKQILTNKSLGFEGPMEGIFTVAPNGRTYASHEIGNTLFLLPVAGLNLIIENSLGRGSNKTRTRYLTGFVTSFTPCVYSATTIALLYVLLRLVFAVPLRRALGGVLAFSFCTFFWSFSRNLFDGVLCCLLLTGAALCLFLFSRNLKYWALGAAMTLLGLAVITRLSMILALFSAGLYLLLRFRNERARLVRVVLFAGLILAPFAAWQLFYNNLRTGHALISPVQTVQYAANNALDGNLLLGLSGLLFSPGKSIFVYCPLALLSLFCVLPMWRRYRLEAIFILALAIPWFILHAKLRSWYGAWGWGPRHFLTISPMLALPFLACGEALLRERLPRLLTALACGWGFVLGLSSIVGNEQFRLSRAFLEGRGDALIWSANNNQAVDMIRGFGQNIARMFFGAPFDNIPGLSEANYLASNTVNVWLVSAYHQGVSPLILGIMATVLLFVSAACLIALYRPSAALADTLEAGAVKPAASIQSS